MRAERRMKRGGGEVRGNSAFQSLDGFDNFANPGPAPEILAEMQEQYALLLAKLPDQTLRKIAIAKMEGYSTEEIAKTVGVAIRTIQRKLELIRACWQNSE